MKPRKTSIWFGGGVVLAVVVVIGLGVAYLRRPILPSAIRKQVSFVVFCPATSTGFKVERSSIKYSSQLGVLSFTLKGPAGTIVVSEQATPDQINNLPDYYTHLLDSLNDYQDFSSPDGTVALTHPTELKGGQTAVFNGQGTLLFARPSTALSTTRWRSLFNAFMEIK